jgi:hypothetical protein
VTSLPKTTDQQLVSFGVSPDGTRILATILSIPSNPQSGDFNIAYDVFGAHRGTRNNDQAWSRHILHQRRACSRGRGLD